MHLPQYKEGYDAAAMILHDYFRSSAAYRVRIALNLKGLAAQRRFVHLRRGEQRAPGYLALNPQGLVPMLEVGDRRLTQSLAIIEYLEEKHPLPPLLPQGLEDRAWVRAVALSIACDIHPLNNLRVLKYLGARRSRSTSRGATSGTATGCARASTRSSRSSASARPAPSASAPRPRSPTSASCRRSPTRGASPSTSRPTRASSPSTTPAAPSSPSPTPRPEVQPDAEK